MNIEDALSLLDKWVVNHRQEGLNESEKEIIRRSWDDRKYEEMNIPGYSPGYVKTNLAPGLWKLLSEVTGKKVTKKTLPMVMEAAVKQPSSSGATSLRQSETFRQSQEADKAQDANDHTVGPRSRSSLGRRVEETTSKAPNSVEPVLANNHPPVKQAVTVSVQEQPDYNETRQRGTLIPGMRCHRVWGRDKLIEEILNYLADPQALPILSLNGGPGYGKTEAASQIAQAALKRNLFADVLWVTARQTELVDGKISQQQGYEALNWNQFLDVIAKQLECSKPLVQQRLREEKLLVVLDNAETADIEGILSQLIRMLNPSRALLTSRLKTKTPYVRLKDVLGLEERWSHSLLRNEAQHNEIPALLEATDDQLHQVHELSCGAPLALHFVVGRVYHDNSLEPVLSELEQANGQVEVFYQFTLETAWQRIAETSKNVLRHMGEADAGVIQAELLVACKLTDSDLNAALTALRRWYFIEDKQDVKGNRRYDLHPWVRTSVRGKLVDKWQSSIQDLEQIAQWKYFDI